ncbi:cellulose synthase [Fulvimarina sp. MAC8]
MRNRYRLIGGILACVLWSAAVGPSLPGISIGSAHAQSTASGPTHYSIVDENQRPESTKRVEQSNTETPSHAVDTELQTGATRDPLNFTIERDSSADAENEPTSEPSAETADDPPKEEERSGARDLTVQAQAVPPGGSQRSNSQQTESAEQKVDESALRYFAQQGDTQRLEAEIARLRALYPDWEPPDDPLAVPEIGDPDLDRMWSLYSKGRYAEVRQAITDRQEREPDWTPPPDLLERLRVAENRLRLINASDLRQYDTVIRIATETPSLLTCSEVDVLWRVASAFANTDRPDRTLDAYRYILTNCEDPGERLATMQMATQRLERPALDELLALEKPSPEGPGEFDTIRTELARQSLAEAGDESDLTVPETDLRRIRQIASDTDNTADQILLGWYYLERDNAAEAERWFRQSREIEITSEASRGLALALLRQNEPSEAELVIRPFADESEDAGEVYVAATANLLSIDPPPIQPTTILRLMVDTVARLEDVNGARELGWYSYDLSQFATAELWFETTLNWEPDDESAAFGLALTRKQLGDEAGLESVQLEWTGRSPRIAAVGSAADTAEEAASSATTAAQATTEMAASSATPDRADPPSREQRNVEPRPMAYTTREQPPAITRTTPPVTAQPARKNRRQEAPNRTGRSCSESIDPRTLSPQAALARGWCLMDLNRPIVAAKAFQVALSSNSPQVRQDAAYGQSLAYIRAGLSDKAAVSAAKQPQSSARRIELATSLLGAQAVESFESERPVETLQALNERSRIAPERIDLMILRGYAYLDLRRYSDAERVFAAVAAAGSREGARGLNAVREATGYYGSD